LYTWTEPSVTVYRVCITHKNRTGVSRLTRLHAPQYFSLPIDTQRTLHGLETMMSLSPRFRVREAFVESKKTMPRTLRNGKVVVHDPTLLGRNGELSRKPLQDAENASGNTRWKRKKVESLREALASVPPAPPSPTMGVPETRVARGASPTCLAFGGTHEERKRRFPGFYFCSKCVSYITDYRLAMNKARIDRSSHRYRCEGDHLSFDHPTTRLKHIA
jgi:hypothetical protein